MVLAHYRLVVGWSKMMTLFWRSSLALPAAVATLPQSTSCGCRMGVSQNDTVHLMVHIHDVMQLLIFNLFSITIVCSKMLLSDHLCCWADQHPKEPSRTPEEPQGPPRSLHEPPREPQPPPGPKNVIWLHYIQRLPFVIRSYQSNCLFLVSCWVYVHVHIHTQNL